MDVSITNPMEEVQAAARVIGCCRFCYGDVVVGEEDGIIPCECKDGGLPQVAHRSCVQTWISIRPNLPSSNTARPDVGSCEVCGCAWKQDYDIPAAPVEPTPEELAERAHVFLIRAYTRYHGIGGQQPREEDVLILRVLGPNFPGPWDDLVKRLRKKAEKDARRASRPPSRVQRLSATVGHLFRRSRTPARERGLSSAAGPSNDAASQE